MIFAKINRYTLWTIIAICVITIIVLSRIEIFYGDYLPSTEVAIKNLSTAIDSYEKQYGQLPVSDSLRSEQDNATLIAVLTDERDCLIAKGINPKGIAFLAVKPQDIIQGKWVDRWGNPYHIVLDIHKSGKIEIAGQSIANSKVIWSDGPNRINEYGRGDDICSWKPSSWRHIPKIKWKR